MGPAVLYQDNLSAIKLAENGASSAERTRHIAIRFFWLKDRVDAGELAIVYCPTADMVADLLTKPMQGEAFRRLRRQLLNWGNNVDEFTITIGKTLYLFRFILKKKAHPLTLTLLTVTILTRFSGYQQLLDMQERVMFYPSRLHIFAAVRAFFCYCCGGATPRAYKVEEWLRC